MKERRDLTVANSTGGGGQQCMKERSSNSKVYMGGGRQEGEIEGRIQPTCSVSIYT